MRNTFNATAQWNLEHSNVSLFAGNDLSNFGNAGSREREEYGFPGRSVLRSTDILDYLKSTYSDVNYGYACSTFNKMEQANAYLKVAWQLNIGKKVNPESNNSSRVYPSSIMK